MQCLVRVATRDRQHTLLKRPIQLLYPLEIGGSESSGDTTGSTGDSRTLETPERDARPVRAAARRANEQRKVWIQELLD